MAFRPVAVVNIWVVGDILVETLHQPTYHHSQTKELWKLRQIPTGTGF